MNTHEADGAAEIRPDDQRLAADPVGEPAGEQGHRHAEHDERAVHQAGRRLVEPKDPGQIDEREQVHDAQAAPAATEDRREEQPAQVAVGDDPAQSVPAAAAGDSRGPVRAAFADERQDAQSDQGRGHAEHDRHAAPAERGEHRRPDDRDDDRAQVPAGDMGADRKPAAGRRELLGEEAVPDRVLRRPTDPGEDRRDRERDEVVGQRRGREPATEHEAAQAQQPAAGHAPGQLRVAELDHPRREGAHRGEDRHGRDCDTELVDDRQEDRRQQHGIGVIDRVRHRQQPERAHRMDRREGLHRAILPERLSAGRGPRRRR